VGLGGWSSTCCEVGSERWRDMRLVAGEILSARPNGDLKSPEGKKKKKKKPWVSQTHSQRDLAKGLGGQPGWSTLHRGFLPSSFFLLLLFSFFFNRKSAAVGCKFFFLCIFFSLYVRCQLVSGRQKTYPFCHN
jgi:hypothetical protein